MIKMVKYFNRIDYNEMIKWKIREPEIEDKILFKIDNKWYIKMDAFEAEKDRRIKIWQKAIDYYYELAENHSDWKIAQMLADIYPKTANSLYIGLTRHLFTSRMSKDQTLPLHVPQVVYVLLKLKEKEDDK